MRSKKQNLGRGYVLPPDDLSRSMKKCPVCGKRFRQIGNLDEWGPVSNSTALCSIPCMRAWEDICLRERTEKIRASRGYQMLLLQRAGKTTLEIAERTGVKRDTVQPMINTILDFYWQELAMLDGEAAG